MSESILFYHSANDPRWTPCNYEAISKEGFQKNVIAFRAISLISRGIASIPMSLKTPSLDNNEKLRYELSNGSRPASR